MIVLENITKKYGDKSVFENFCLSLKEGKTTAILGASGSGKTTLLNIMAGLTDYEGRVTGREGKAAFVFQRDALVKNLTVKENVLLVNRSANAKELLARAGLAEAADLYPKQLSGGMARRVSLVRAFAYPAKLILLDEPFFGLDPALKEILTADFKSLAEKDGRTAVLVTHEVKEAVKLASRAVVISGGKVFFDKPDLTEADENLLYQKTVAAGLNDMRGAGKESQRLSCGLGD